MKKAMASSDKELELLLTEAGNKLLEPSSSVDELITLLDVSPSILFKSFSLSSVSFFWFYVMHVGFILFFW